MNKKNNNNTTIGMRKLNCCKWWCKTKVKRKKNVLTYNELSFETRISICNETKIKWKRKIVTNVKQSKITTKKKVKELLLQWMNGMNDWMSIIMQFQVGTWENCRDYDIK